MRLCFYSTPARCGLPSSAMSDSSPTGSPSRSDECRIQGWTAPEDAACRALQGSHTPYPYNQATLAHQQQASLDTSFSQPFHFTGQGEHSTMVVSGNAMKPTRIPHSQHHGHHGRSGPFEQLARLSHARRRFRRNAARW